MFSRHKDPLWHAPKMHVRVSWAPQWKCIPFSFQNALMSKSSSKVRAWTEESKLPSGSRYETNHPPQPSHRRLLWDNLPMQGLLWAESEVEIQIPEVYERHKCTYSVTLHRYTEKPGFVFSVLLSLPLSCSDCFKRLWGEEKYWACCLI